MPSATFTRRQTRGQPAQMAVLHVEGESGGKSIILIDSTGTGTVLKSGTKVEFNLGMYHRRTYRWRDTEVGGNRAEAGMQIRSQVPFKYG